VGRFFPGYSPGHRGEAAANIRLMAQGSAILAGIARIADDPGKMA
jgi:hypothetical protein